MKTQEQILERLNNVDDFMGIQKSDLIDFMDFENAKEFLKEDYVSDVESGTKKWEAETDARSKIIDYLPFAFGKAYGQRGISAGRSLLHFKTWIWLDDEDFYSKMSGGFENYSNYGLSQLIKIAKHYGQEIPAE